MSALLYFVGFEFIDSYAEAKLEEYDQETTTSSDFTAIYRIPPELFENFKQNIYPTFNEDMYQTTGKTQTLIMAFKFFLSDGIVTELSDDVTEEQKGIDKLGIDRSREEDISKNYTTNNKNNTIITDGRFFKTEKNFIDLKQHSKEEEVKMDAYEKDFTPMNRFDINKKKKIELQRLPSNKSEPQGISKNRTAFLNKLKSPSTLEDYFNKTNNIEIADIQFSFKNRAIHQLLFERGKQILENNHETKRMIEEEIHATIKRDHQTLTTPVCAFMTFANEESYLRATELNKVRMGNKIYYKKYWQGHPLYFKPALEPSSIMWENQYVPQNEKVWKLIVSLLVVFLILLSSFSFLFYSQKEIYDYMNIYPYIDCDSIVKTYGDSLEHYGVLEWSYLKETLKTKDLTSSTGTLSCF